MSGNSSSPICTKSACPNCGKPLVLRSLLETVCISCNEPVRLSWAYRRLTASLALVVVLLIALATYSRMSAGPWIIELILLWPLATLVFYAAIPARYERGTPQPQLTFLVTLFTVFFSIFTVEFLGYLSLYIILGARPADVRELLDMLSAPLGMISSQFVIMPDRTFLDVFGIMLGNSFLIAIPVFICAKVVQVVFRRNRVTQMGLSSSLDDDE